MTDQSSENNVQQVSETKLEQAITEATEAVAIQANELEELDRGEASGAPIGLGGVLNVPVQVTVRVGTAQLTLAELVELGPGSLVVLDRDAHEPADIMVNGKLVARGEVVTIEEKYAVRISAIL
jgi:flagellar motor switch protein FliN/FliY